MVNFILRAKQTAKKQSFIASVLLLVVVFAIGIVVGKTSSNSELTKIEELMKSNELATESYVVEQNLMESFETDCSFAQIRLAELSDTLWRMGQTLSTDASEKNLGKTNHDYLSIKFRLMQAKVYILYKQFKEQCQTNTTVILFYFKRNDNSSGMQGAVLDQIVKDFGAKVFAIEYGRPKELGFIEEYYGIKTAPALIIDFATKKQGFVSYEELAELLVPEAKD